MKAQRENLEGITKKDVDPKADVFKQRRLDHAEGTWTRIGTIDLMFSHLDNNLSGREFPEHNFVFSDNFRQILVSAGLDGLIDD